MKSRDRRSLNFIRVVLSSSSLPEFCQKDCQNLYHTICQIKSHGGDHSKKVIRHVSKIEIAFEKQQ